MNGFLMRNIPWWLIPLPSAILGTTGCGSDSVGGTYETTDEVMDTDCLTMSPPRTIDVSLEGDELILMPDGERTVVLQGADGMYVLTMEFDLDIPDFDCRIHQDVRFEATVLAAELDLTVMTKIEIADGDECDDAVIIPIPCESINMYTYYRVD